MTAVAPSASVASRVAQHEATLAQLRAEELDLARYLEEAPAREQAARIEHMRVEPRKIPGLSSEPEKERKAAEKARKQLADVQANIAATEVVLVERKQELVAQQRETVEAEIRVMQDGIRDTIRLGGEAVADLAAVYGRLVDQARALDDARSFPPFAFASPDEHAAWRHNVANLVLCPFPADFLQFVTDLWSVSADTELNQYRTNASRRYDEFGELVALTPDLRDQVKTFTTHRDGNDIRRSTR